MKKIYSFFAMLTMMVAALSLSACGGDDDVDNGGGDGSYDDNQYCHVYINGELQHNDWAPYFFPFYETHPYNGTEVYYYGGIADNMMISYQDAIDLNIYAGFTSTDAQEVFPKPEGTYDIIIRQSYDEYYSNNVGMNIIGGNMKYRTVTSGFLKITKVSKCKSQLSKMLYNREDAYATEGNFSFILTDNWDGNENEITGDFRVVF